MPAQRHFSDARLFPISARWWLLGLSWLVTFAAHPAAQTSDALAPHTAAVVNGDIITREALKAALGQNADKASEQSRMQAQTSMLNQLMDETLTFQAAHKAGIHTQEETLSLMRRMRRKILHDAFVQRQWQLAAPVEPAQINHFIAANPQLFKNRKTFQFSRTSFVSPESWTDAELQLVFIPPQAGWNWY